MQRIASQEHRKQLVEHAVGVIAMFQRVDVTALAPTDRATLVVFPPPLVFMASITTAGLLQLIWHPLRMWLSTR